jgi:hypothetical protein
MLEIGTFLMRSESELVLKSRRVVPRRLLESGFVFEHRTWPEAARDLCRQWREMRGGEPPDLFRWDRVPRHAGITK